MHPSKFFAILAVAACVALAAWALVCHTGSGAVSMGRIQRARRYAAMTVPTGPASTRAVNEQDNMEPADPVLTHPVSIGGVDPFPVPNQDDESPTASLLPSGQAEFDAAYSKLHENQKQLYTHATPVRAPVAQFVDGTAVPPPPVSRGLLGDRTGQLKDDLYLQPVHV